MGWRIFRGSNESRESCPDSKIRTRDRNPRLWRAPHTGGRNAKLFGVFNLRWSGRRGSNPRRPAWEDYTGIVFVEFKGLTGANPGTFGQFPHRIRTSDSKVHSASSVFTC